MITYRSRIDSRLIRSRSGALVASLAFSTVATGALLICVPLELRELNATPAETGVTLAMFGFGMFAFEWLWGAIADRYGYAAPLAVSQVLYALFIALLSLAHTVPLMAVTYFLACGMMVAVGPIPRSYLGTALRAGLRATGLALLSSQWVLAEAVGSGLGGQLIDRIPIRTVILLAAALPLVSAVLIAPVFRGYPRQSPVERPPERRLTPSRRPAGIMRVLATVAVLAFLVQVGLGGELALLPLLVTERLHLSASAAGGALLVLGLIAGSLLVPGGRVADRWGRRPAMVAGAAVCALGYVVYAMATSFPAVIGGAVLRAVGASLVWPAATAWMAESMPRRRHALYMGLFGEFENVGVTVGPIVGGAVWAVAGIQSAFYAYAAAAAAAAVVAGLAVVGRAAPALHSVDDLGQDVKSPDMTHDGGLAR